MNTDDIIIEKGDDYSNLITVTSDDVIQDITNFKFFFTAKARLSNDDTNAAIKIDWHTHFDAPNGLTVLTIPHSVTDILEGTYVYDLQMLDNTGEVTTVAQGKLIINYDVTRRNT